MKRAECIVCRKVFEVKSYHHKYCSIKCKSKFLGFKRKYKNVCGFCGKEFNPNRRNQKFCSLYCSVRGREGKTKRAEKDNNLQCYECGKSIYRKPYQLSKSKRFFCSSYCMGQNRKKIYIGGNNPNFKDVPPRKCVACGQEYFSYNKRRKYCGTNCAKAEEVGSQAMANLKRGADAERKCCKDLEAKGYHATRSAASKGEYDVIAISDQEILLIQVKRTKNTVSSSCTPKIIEKVIKAKSPNNPCIKKQIWCWLDRKGWYIIDIPSRKA